MPRGSGSQAILSVKGNHGESEMKVREALVRVFEPGRLQMAWQQVRMNVGAAEIDQMISDPARVYNRFIPDPMGSVTDRGAVYLAGTYRSVGRG
jgi:hypothetical protein